MERVAMQQTGGALEGIDGVIRVIEQLAGMPLPASLWESQILPARVHDYAPSMLDELIATGTVLWSGYGRLGQDDGLVGYVAAGFSVRWGSAAACLTVEDASCIGN